MITTKVSCSCPVKEASSALEKELQILGVTPVITSEVIRVVYEGTDKGLGTAIVELFCREVHHEITVDYDAKERRKEMRKAERAAWNARLHGH